jgi:hypothetical protein
VLSRWGTLLVSTLIGLSALPWIWFALGTFGGFDWQVFGFETLTLFASVFGIMLGLGRYKQGWAIGVTSIAGSWLVCLVFGVYLGFYVAKRTDFPDLIPLSQATLMGRVVGMGLVMALATMTVFNRNPGSWSRAIKGVIWALPLVIMGALLYLDTGPGAWISNLMSDTSGSGGVRAVVTIFVGIVSIVLISISGHLLIAAFENGRPEALSSQNPGSQG